MSDHRYVKVVDCPLAGGLMHPEPNEARPWEVVCEGCGNGQGWLPEPGAEPFSIDYAVERQREAGVLVGEALSALSEARTAIGDALQVIEEGIGGDDED